MQYNKIRMGAGRSLSFSLFLFPVFLLPCNWVCSLGLAHSPSQRQSAGHTTRSKPVDNDGHHYHFQRRRQGCVPPCHWMSRVCGVKPPSGSSHKCTSCKSENLRVWWLRHDQWRRAGADWTPFPPLFLFRISHEKNTFTPFHFPHLPSFFPHTLALFTLFHSHTLLPRSLIVTMMRLTVATTVRRTLVQPSQRVAPIVVSTRFYSEAFKKKEKAAEEVFFRQRVSPSVNRRSLR